MFEVQICYIISIIISINLTALDYTEQTAICSDEVWQLQMCYG